jgi:rhodanese-related sulfurtransferase
VTNITAIVVRVNEFCMMNYATLKTSLFLGLSIVFFSTSCSTKQSVSETTEKIEVTTQKSESKNKLSVIIDVRSKEEWDNDGHAPCATLIPLDELPNRMQEFAKYEKITFVCRSGNRAQSAVNYCTENGINAVENGGSWQSVECP